MELCGRWVNVLAVWRDLNGVTQRGFYTLKPHSKNHPMDKTLYESLKKRGVPEVIVRSQNSY